MRDVFPWEEYVLARSLVEWQWPDGGWNCDPRASGRRSSFHESLAPAWGLHEYWLATGAEWARDASRRAAELYGLEVLAERIQTYPDNSTRFGALSRDPKPISTPDKSSLVFGVGHVSGSLYRCLGAFAERHLSLTKLESRPRPGRPWEYVFYVDVDASAHRPDMIEALAALSEHATFTRLLGSYAAAVQRR